MSDDVWKNRFNWLIEQHWVEDEVGHELGIDYQSMDEYKAKLISSIDKMLDEDQPA